MDTTDDDPPPGEKLSKHKSEMKDADIWIMSPREERDPSKSEYGDKVKKMKEAFTEVLGDKATFHDARYAKPIREDDDVIQLLIEYDPKPKKKRVRFMYYGQPIIFDGEPGKLSG